ncbi:MAG: sulfite exporter TauE/SafE family protein [Hydrotalea sp.]|nr:sulfite exporter TauE/SafE family protein [Hydrotalea sp.]
MKRNKQKKSSDDKSEDSAVNKKLFAAVTFVFLAGVVATVWYAITKQGDTFDYNLLLTGLLVGIVAQTVDGALGMAYGITTSSFLLATGASPLIATASVHIAEIFTTGASALSHWYFRNVNKKVLIRLALGGVVGALVGVYTVVNFDSKLIKPYVSGYLLLMGLYVLFRAFRRYQLKIVQSLKEIPYLGFVAGFFDSIGGGGWGPILTTTLLGQGRDPRTTIGTVNSAEFFITTASGSAFFTIVGLQSYEIVIGLILGGMVVSPFAAKFVKHVPQKFLYILVGLLISGLSIYNLVKALS